MQLSNKGMVSHLVELSDPRFPHGTIAMQQPFFKEKGLDLERYFPGTINLSIAPYRYSIVRAKYTFRELKWSSLVPSEDFSFFDCRIDLDRDRKLAGLIYHPHADTKPEHFQPPDLVEILTEYINELRYGDKIILEVDSTQLVISD